MKTIQIPQYNLPMNSRPIRKLVICGLSPQSKKALEAEEKKIDALIDRIIAQESK